jgi:hypothetical protein
LETPESMVYMFPLSSAVSSIGYNEEQKVMSVEFIDRDRVYWFSNVPYEIFVEFVQGGEYGSVGTYYHKQVRGNPEYQLMTESGE